VKLLKTGNGAVAAVILIVCILLSLIYGLAGASSVERGLPSSSDSVTHSY